MNVAINVTTVVLGAFAGTCFYAAVHHLQIALHLKKRSPHILLAVTGVAFGVMSLRHIHAYIAVAPSVIEALARTGVPIALLGVGALYWFVGLRAGVSRKLLIACTVLLTIAVVVNELVPTGIVARKVTGFQDVLLPWGDVYHRPIIEPTRLKHLILVPALLVPLALLFYAITGRSYDGDLPEAGPLAAVLVTAVLPAVMVLALMPAGYMPVPVMEAGFTGSMVVLSLLTSHDVAQTTLLREDLLRSEERFRRLVDTAPEAIALFDPRDDRCLGANDRSEQLLARPLEEIRHLNLVEFLCGRSQPDGSPALDQIRQLKQRALAREAPVSEWELRRSDGSAVPCELRLSALETQRSSLLRVSLLDVTERKQAERAREDLEHRLRQSEKLETLGTLAGGIAHELNNMLTPIVGYGELALEMLEVHPARPDVTEMVTAAERARQLTRHILTFSRQVESPHEAFLIQPVMRQALRFLRATLPPRITLVTELAAPHARIQAGPADLNQVIMSLGTNAAEAMEGEGQLNVSLRQHEDVVVLSVSDTGAGMDAATRERAFDPFFTTKRDGTASGLGLSVVHGIVTASGGTIEVESAPGRGATFRIRIPLVKTA